MSTRRHISKKASLESTFTPPTNPLKTRGFGKGIQARSAELPTTNRLQTRPIGSPQFQQPDTRSIEEQRSGAERFGYNAANIPVNAPGTPPPPPLIQRKEGGLGNGYQLPIQRVEPIMNRFDQLKIQQFGQAQTGERKEVSEEEELQEQPEAETGEQPLLEVGEEVLQKKELQTAPPQEEMEGVERLSETSGTLIQRDCGENMSCPEDMMNSSMFEEPNASYPQEEPNASYYEEPNASYSQETSATDHARSAGEHLTRTTLRQTALRDIYLRGDAAIRAEAQAMVAAGKSEVEAARWAVQARNQLRQTIRDQGEPIVDAIAQARRGARDMPTYESLRARGKTDAQIIESAGRSNAGVNRWVGRIRIAGRILIAVDIGIGAYNVATAPEVDRPRVLAREVGRVGGALAGGWAGAKGGAAVGGFIGSFFGPGPGTAIGAGIGSVIGGIGGAIGGGWAGSSAAEWAIEQFYPPAETRFEGSFE